MENLKHSVCKNENNEVKYLKNTQRNISKCKEYAFGIRKQFYITKMKN